MAGLSAIKPALDVKAVRALTTGVLGRPAVPATTITALIQLCRQTSALDEARALMDKLVAADASLPEAQALLAAFDGRRPPQGGACSTPAPFIRRRNFLDPDARAKLFAALTAAAPRFQPSQIAADPAVGDPAAPNERASLVLYRPGALVDDLVAALSGLLSTEVYPRFGIDPAAVRDIDVQATYHGDGHFFAPHTDADLQMTNRRAVSFVYYLHSEPRAFTGGDLILYDGRPKARAYARHAYTRVTPEDNSLIAFPSATLHQVERVSLPDTASGHGRLTVNGWVRLTG